MTAECQNLKKKNTILNNLLQSITSNNYWIPHKVLFIVHSKEKIHFNKQLRIAQNNKTATSQLRTLSRHRVDWHTNKLDTQRHSISNVLNSQIFQEVLLLVPQGCTISVYFSFVVVLFVRVLVGQTWPSSLNIISTAFNCSCDTESEYIWLWFMGSYLYSSIW